MRFGNLKTATGSLLAVLGICAMSRSAAAAVDYTAQILYTVNAGAGVTITIPDSPGYALNGQVAAFVGAGSQPHAAVWKGNHVLFDLQPANYFASRAYATSGTQQVGNGTFTSNNQDFFTHALMWSGTVSSMVDLNPAGYGLSEAWGTNGTQQVGDAVSSQYHAGLWNGTAASFVDLHPAGFSFTTAQGTTGTQQVGFGFGTTTGGVNHALLWTGSAASYKDLNPAGYAESIGSGIGGNQQVGFAHILSGGDDRAMLWQGTAASAVDLMPTSLAGFTYSDALATNGSIQAGFGGPGGITRALAWSGTADSVVNLHALLPATMFQSVASGVDANGDIFGTANDASNIYAVEWIPVPEPTSIMLLVPGMLLIRRRPVAADRSGWALIR